MREIDEKLWHAVLARDEKSIMECLQKGANPLSMNDHGVTIVQITARENFESALKILLDFTENKLLEAKVGEHEVTILTLAVAQGHENIIRLLLARGANIEARGKSGVTPLVEAIARGRPNIVKLLVDHGADVNAKSDDSSPLELAVLLGNKEIIQILIDAKADLEDKEIIQILIDAKADLEAKDLNGKTVLLRAVDDENIGIVKLLLENGANINACDSEGQTPLHIAAKKGNVAILQLLLTKGAAVNIKTADGVTPLHLAVMESIDCVDLLLKNNADPNVYSNQWGTPFTQAVMSENEKLLHLFLNTGKIDINTVAQGHENIIRLLLARGATIEARGKSEVMPLNFSGLKNSQTTSTLFKPPPPNYPRPKANLETDQLLKKNKEDESKCCVII